MRNAAVDFPGIHHSQPERRGGQRITAIHLALRFVPLAAVPILLAASTYPGRFSVPVYYWLLAVAAAGLFVIGRRFPTAVSVGISVLAAPMFATEAWGVSSLVPYLGAVALAEAAIRDPRRRNVAVATAFWFAAYAIGNYADASVTPTVAAISTVVFVGGPLLIGLYVHAQRELATTYRHHAAEAEKLTRAAERNAVGRELHDIVAHHMASIILQVGVARHTHRGTSPVLEKVLDDVHQTSTEALANIRQLLAALRDPTLTEVTFVSADSLRTDIRAAVERTRAAGFIVETTTDFDTESLDTLGRLTLVRIFQEAMTNVMKHASPQGPVTAHVDQRDRGVTVTVTNTRLDNAPTSRTGHGHGLIGMSERADLTGGWARTSVTATTWRVDAWIPLSPATPTVGIP